MAHPNAPYTNLDYQQVIKQSYDEAQDLLRVGIVGATLAPIDVGGLAVQINHTEDSVRLGNGTSYISSTTNGLKIGVDVNVINDTLAVTQSGTWNINNISGTVSLPTGAATSANQTNGQQRTMIVNGDNVPVNTKALGSQLLVGDEGLIVNSIIHGLSSAGGGTFVDVKVNPSGALNVAATQDGTWNINNVSGTVSLPTGASTLSAQTTGNNSLSSIDGKLANNFGVATGALRVAAQLGNASGTADFGAGTTSAQTVRVVLPTDQTSIPAAQSGTWNINNISGTISLPTGAATSTSISTVNSSTVALNNGQTFTGTWEDSLGYNTITVACLTDKSGTMTINFSPDGTNVDSSLNFTIAASINEVHRLTCTRRYFRVVITNNSGANQTYLRLQTIKGNHPLLTSPLNQSLQTDADSIVTRSVLYGTDDSGQLSAITASSDGQLDVNILGPRLPFGSLHTESLTPVFQIDGTYGMNSFLVKSTISGTGAVTTSDSAFVCSTGTTVNSEAVLQSRKRLRYRGGQGMVMRFTALFTTPVASSYQLAGIGHAEDGLYFGYKDTDFGILYVNRGVRETRTLTITTASSTAQNVTVTLNGVAYTVAVTNSANINRTAYEISLGNFGSWSAEVIGATIVFVASSAGSLNGTYSLTATTAVGSFARTKAGVASTDQFIKQSDWNVDKFDGTGHSGITLVPTNYNVFQIKMQYLGAGVQVFEIETIVDGVARWAPCHILKFPNTLTASWAGNPSFPFTLATYSAGSTTNLTVKSICFAGFVEGEKHLHGPRFSYFDLGTSISNSVYTSLISIKNTLYYSGRVNQSIINLLSLSAAQQHNNLTSIYLVRNATLVGNPVFTQYATNSVSYIDTAATSCTFTNDQIVWSGQLGATSNLVFAFSDEITLQPGEMITLCAKTAAGSSTAMCSLNTREDQ